MARTLIRSAYGQAFFELASQNADVIAVTVDSVGSAELWETARTYPERVINVGIAEAGAVNVGVGLALGGLIPFVNCFAPAITLRAGEQVRTNVCYAKTNVKLVGLMCGLSGAQQGPTHHSVCDLAVMRALPHMTVIVPADVPQTRQAVHAIATHHGPVYLRVPTGRFFVPELFDGDQGFEIGKGISLREGVDVTIVATGIMVSKALDAADRLQGEGMRAGVIAIHTIKPIDRDLIIRAASQTGCLVTAEEHSIIGGLGGAVVEALCDARPVPVVRVGIDDTFTESGPWPDLVDRWGMSVDDVVAASRKAVAIKHSSLTTTA